MTGYFDDVAAQTTAMMDNFTGAVSGIYIGYSLGSLQMIGALSLASIGDIDLAPITDNIQHAIFLAPCQIVEEFTTVGTLSGLGINSMPSDNWEADVQSICTALGEDDIYC